MTGSGDQVTLKYLGISKGTVTLRFDDTIGDLRRVVTAQSTAGPVQLIAGGRKLQDDSKTLRDCGLTASRTLHILRAEGSTATAEFQRQEARASSLTRLQSAAEALARRRGDRPSHGAPELSLENQDGTVMHFENDGDRQALIMGLSLHEKGRISLTQGNIQEALDELLIADEAFALCNPSHLPLIDNIGLLSLDIVWCMFQLRQLDKLGQARERLAAARAALAKSHGPQKERLRMLHGNFLPQLAIYVRLEALEGIAAFHGNDLSSAAANLHQARSTWQSLQVSDEGLSSLVSMGFSTRRAARALRFWAGDIGEAAQWLVKDRQERQERRAKDVEIRQQRRQQERLGTTPKGMLVDMDLHEKLCKLGYDASSSAEALRLTENNPDAALDMLTDPDALEALQLSIMESQERAEKRRRRSQAPNGAGMNAHGTHAANSQPAAESGQSSVDGIPGALHPSEPQQDVPEDDSPEHAVDSLEDRDVEAEEALIQGVSNDPLAAYDVDVREEGQAIQEYLGRIEAMKESQNS